MVKLRDLNKLRSRIGFSEVDSQMTKEIREITDTTVSIIIVLELNQSVAPFIKHYLQATNTEH